MSAIDTCSQVDQGKKLEKADSPQSHEIGELENVLTDVRLQTTERVLPVGVSLPEGDGVGVPDHSSATDAPPPPPPQPPTRGTTGDFPIPPRLEPTAEPKVKRTVQYRQTLDNSILYTHSVDEDEKSRRSHKGAVFEIIDVKMTAETKDTNKAFGAKENDEAQPQAPTVSAVARQFIRIYSPAVLNALQAVVNYYPKHTVIGSNVEVQEPYAILVHHWDELKEYREKFRPEALDQDENAKECRLTDTYEHLGYVLDFLEEKWGEKVRKERERWTQSIPKVSYEMLWLLLKPGTDIYCDIDQTKSREPFVISFCEMDVYNNAIHGYRIHMWNLTGTDYRFIAPGSTFTIVTRFDGEKRIDALEAFPCEYLTDHTQVRAKLVKRGQRFLELRRKKCMYFDGESISHPKRAYKGYVMTDPKQFSIDHPSPPVFEESVDEKPSTASYCACTRCANLDSESRKPAKFDGYGCIYPLVVSQLTDHQYFICTNGTSAFCFRIREWRLLALDGFQEPKWDLGLINNLVMNPSYKKLILNLSETFMAQTRATSRSTYVQPQQPQDSESTTTISADELEPWSADFIQNKGGGLTFLLHGKPGVGKTYTAECVAEHIKRPLLPITCADIGVDPSKVETKLVYWFKLARSWDAVMLLDEADIYMEYRQIHDLTRNNLVASFLRSMEYFEGILFLTTNRVGTFDEAFLSRINLTIYYPDFQDEQREQIWNNYFEKLEREAGDRFYVSESTRDFACGSELIKQMNWNGREIRNAFQIAVNLAQADGSKDKKGRFVLKRDHIKVTADLSKDFKNYMVSVHKKNESQRAQLMGYRYDAFNAPKDPKQDFV